MKMNRIRLQKQVETMNKEQLICLCKSLIDIYCELEDRKDKAIETLEKRIKENEEIDYVDMTGKSYINYQKEIIEILRGKDKPEYLGYSDKECINCGRLRVEKYSDGTEICEKCNFDQNKKEYVLRGEDNE